MSVDKSKRDFIKKASYAAPVLITLTAMPAHATYGSCQNRTKDGDGGSYSYWESRFKSYWNGD
ncbi:MAG: hypothetical protein PVF40_10620 [Ectothiorhodospiraceae bacterium]|jgi:hypothetical protein